jgi:hypothetical protein
MKGRLHGRSRRGQFLILTAVVLVFSIILISTVLNAAMISRTEYVETNFKEIVQKISTDFPKALGGALSNASLTYKATEDMAKAISNAEIYLANWRKNILDRYVGFGMKLDISDPIIELEWATPNEGRSSITASVELALTTLGFSGWNDTRTVEAYAQVQRTPESVVVTPNRLTFNMTFVGEDGTPMAGLTSSLLEIKTHYIGAQKAYQDVNMSTTALRYFDNGLYNITAETDKMIDAFKLFAYDDRGVVVGLTVDLAIPPDVAIVKNIRLVTYPDRTKAFVKVVSTSNEPIEGATVYGHWEGNVTTADRRPLIVKTNAGGIAEFAVFSSLFQRNSTTLHDSTQGRIDFKVDDVSFVPVIDITSPQAYSGSWSYPTGALADGGSTPTQTSTSDAVVSYRSYSFGIPSYVKIMNVWLRLDSWTSGDDYIRVEVSYDGGSTFMWSGDRYPPYSSSEPTPSDTYPLWIQLNSTSQSGWNVTQLENASFYFRVTKRTLGWTNTVYLDYIPIVVLYQPNFRYEPLRSVTQASAIKRGASGFVGTWNEAANALRNDTAAAYAYRCDTTTILRPNADGVYQQWSTFGSGGSHWSRTSDQSDATGVQNPVGSTSAIETVNLENMTQAGAINWVTAYMRAKSSGQTIEITFVGYTSSGGSNPTSGRFSLPSGWQAGDFAIFWWYTYDSTKTFTSPNGLTQKYQTAVSYYGRLYVGYRVLQPGDSTFTWTSSSVSGSTTVWGASVFRNVDPNNPWDADSGSPATFTGMRNPDPPAVTTVTDNAMVFVLFGKRNDYTSITPPTGYASAGSSSSTSGYDASAGTAYKMKTTSGSEDPGPWSLGGGSSYDDGQVWTGALRPVGSNPVEQARILLRTHDEDYESPDFTVSRVSFADYSWTLTTNPWTGDYWTWDEVNALQTGSRATALGPNEYLQVSEFWIVVNYTVAFKTETYYGFNFNIPSEAIISYVDVQSDLRLAMSGNDYVNISLTKNSGSEWMPAQPFEIKPLTTTERTYHVNVTGWCRWAPGDLNGDDFQVNISKVNVGEMEQVNLEYLAVYVEYYIKPTLSPRFMHVDNITLYQQGATSINLRANVKIVNARLEPVSAVRVYVNITDLANHSSWLLNMATASNGIAAFTLAGVQPGHTYTLTVDNIVKSEWVYDAESNYESSKSYAIT